MTKKIYSARYGKNPKEGLQLWLLANLPGYQRSQLSKYINGFNEFLKKPDKKNSHALCSGNFMKWTDFVRIKSKEKKSLNDEVADLETELDALLTEMDTLRVTPDEEQNATENALLRQQLNIIILQKNSRLLEIRDQLGEKII